jgi:hypothetical protein
VEQQAVEVYAAAETCGSGVKRIGRDYYHGGTAGGGVPCHGSTGIIVETAAA